MSSLLAGLLLPPASLLLVAGAGLWFGRSRRWGLWMAAVALAALALLSMPVTAVMLARPFEAAYRPLNEASFRPEPGGHYMVVVLGGGRDLGAVEYPEGERLSNGTLQRVRYGARLARALRLPLAVAGGSPGGGSESEAGLMRKFVTEELRQPVALVEDKSRNTQENAAFIARERGRLDFTHVIVVTDVIHMPRAVRSFESAGLSVVPAPMRFFASAPWRAQDFLPSSEGMDKSHRVLYELLGMLWYRLRQSAPSR